MIQQEVAHVSDPNKLEAALVCPDNIVASQPEDGSLPDLGPSLQVTKLTALVEVTDQVYENVLCEEFCHSLALRAPFFVKVHIQVPENNGVPEALQGLLQVRQVLQRRQR